MRATAGRPAWRILGRAIGVLTPALLTTGCLLSKLGYQNAETLARWGVADYLDLTPDQERELTRALDAIHTWHRRTELPLYASIALEAARRIERGLQPADLDWAESVYQARYAALTRRAARELAGVAATVTPDQLVKMDRRLAQENARYRAKRLKPKSERIGRQVDEALETIEDWVGPLEKGQERWLGGRLAALPETAEHEYAQRLARQRALRELVTVPAQRDQLTAGLERWLIGWDAGRTAEHERLHAEWLRQGKRLLLDLDRSLTPRQRAHAGERLREYAAKFQAWSRRPVSPEPAS